MRRILAVLLLLVSGCAPQPRHGLSKKQVAQARALADEFAAVKIAVPVAGTNDRRIGPYRLSDYRWGYENFDGGITNIECVYWIKDVIDEEATEEHPPCVADGFPAYFTVSVNLARDEVTGCYAADASIMTVPMPEPGCVPLFNEQRKRARSGGP